MTISAILTALKAEVDALLAANGSQLTATISERPVYDYDDAAIHAGIVTLSAGPWALGVGNDAGADLAPTVKLTIAKAFAEAEAAALRDLLVAVCKGLVPLELADGTAILSARGEASPMLRDELSATLTFVASATFSISSP